MNVWSPTRYRHLGTTAGQVGYLKFTIPNTGGLGVFAGVFLTFRILIR